jgi:hypothetical protein
MVDKITEILVESLRQAVTEPGERRLFKSGKLAGLFSSRTGPAAEAAARALSEGLLEVVRTEAKSKTAIEWVRFTPRAVHFLHEHESPVRALGELQSLLQTSRDAIPQWLQALQRDLAELGNRLTEEARAWSHRLEILSGNVEEALRRADAAQVQLANGHTSAVPWALDALIYLDRRRQTGCPAECPLPELFAALRLQRPDLSVSAFHEGLRRLQDHRTVRLLPFAGSPAELSEPEYVLLDGATVLYYVTR